MIARYPEVKWAETKDILYIDVELSNFKDLSVSVEDNTLKFSAKLEDNLYEFSLVLFDKIKQDTLKYSTARIVNITIEKEESKRWNKLTADSNKLSWLKINWDKWLDEEEEEELKNKHAGGMNDFDFSNFNGMGDMMNNFGGNDFSGYEDGADDTSLDGSNSEEENEDLAEEKDENKDENETPVDVDQPTL